MAQVDYSDKQVLLIDSSGNMRATLFYMLRSMGVVNLKAVTITSRVTSVISEDDYDVILLGHNSSDSYSGVQLLEECRYRGYIKPTACWVFMTGDAAQELILHAVDSRPDALLTKPFSSEVLKQRLDYILTRKQLFAPVEELVEKGELQQAMQYCRNAFAPYDDEYDAACLTLARLQLQAGQPHLAERTAGKMYSDRHDKEAAALYASAMLEQGKARDAERLLTHLITQYPLYIPAYDLLSKTYEQLGDLDSALDTLSNAVSIAPMGIPRQMNLGRVATQAKQLDMASSAYKKSIVLGRHSCYRSPEPYLKLANIRRLELATHSELKQEELYSSFDKLVSEAFKAFPRDQRLRVQASLLRSEMLQQMGDVEGASQCSREAQRANAELAVPLDLGRELLTVTGDRIPVLDKPIQQEMAAPPVRDEAMSRKVNRQGVKSYLAGRMPEALKYFGLATEYDSANPTALLNLAQLFLESARDSQEKRHERLRMVERYLKLASRMVLDTDVQEKQQQLKILLHRGIDELPPGSLGNLLR
ncbi:hypothetical protein ACFVYJ_02800 [Pontibacter sp. JAM-7]|uniref:hypothetical protein n=1 Tax=Pontibacter sp. JAM-7 TaxID=3366581 RepID=UPI003AF79647